MKIASQREEARRADISQTHLSEAERGKRGLSQAARARLVAARRDLEREELETLADQRRARIAEALLVALERN